MRKLRGEAIAAVNTFVGYQAPVNLLGWGVSGFVFLSSATQSAIKVHHYLDAHLVELSAYQFLSQHALTSLHGLQIPKLRRRNSDLRLIEMDIVRPPYLLDFAGVRFSDPQFPPDTLDENHATILDRFGANADVAYSVYESLKEIGMYYLDLRPSNLNLEGLAGLSDDEKLPVD